MMGADRHIACVKVWLVVSLVSPCLANADRGREVPIEQYHRKNETIVDKVLRLAAFPNRNAKGVRAAAIDLALTYAKTHFRATTEQLKSYAAGHKCKAALAAENELRHFGLKPSQFSIGMESNALRMYEAMLSDHPLGKKLSSNSHGCGLAESCALDIRGSAAIGLELAFPTRELKSTGKTIFAVDLGMGTGILDPYLIVGALREGKNLDLHGFEMSATLAIDAARTLMPIFDHNFGERDFRLAIEQGDISRSGPYQILSEHLHQKNGTLGWVVLEAFARTTPRHVVKDGRVDLLQSYRGTPDYVEHDRHFDPFVHALNQLTIAFPDFIDNVKSGRTRLFPDLFNGDLELEGVDSRLKLAAMDGQAIQLNEITGTFSEFEDLGGSARWTGHPLADIVAKYVQEQRRSASGGL